MPFGIQNRQASYLFRLDRLLICLQNRDCLADDVLPKRGLLGSVW